MIRVLRGANALYIGARLFDRSPSAIRARLARRDEELDSDYFAVYLDAPHDRLSAVILRVNPLGCFGDATLNVNGTEDPSWDPVWTVRTTIDTEGWSVEMAVPYSQLVYHRMGDGVWGIQFRRFIYRKQEIADFAFVPKDEQEAVSKFGLLIGMLDLPTSRGLELVPYARARSELAPKTRGNPFEERITASPAAGMDLKYRFSPSLGVRATVNPDFGEVEVDPAVVNLTAHETFYPERRPFFVDGSDIFEFGLSSSYSNFNRTIPFHPRRIGRTPQGTLDGYAPVHTELPEVTTISAAARLAGRVRGGWTLGVLEAVTPRELGRYTDTLGVVRSAPVEPLTNYLATRVKRESRSGSTMLGALGTVVTRDLQTPDLEDMLRSEAYVVGVDGKHYWADRRWSVDANLLLSRVQGSASAIASLQRSSPHYFQRPDAHHLKFDPARTSMDGASGLVSLNRRGGTHWRGSMTYQDWSPGFEINDLGFQNAADARALSIACLYVENKPGPAVRNYSLYTTTNRSWNYGGDLTYAAQTAIARAQFANYWTASFTGTWYPGSLDVDLTRGGPLAWSPSGGDLSVSIGSDPRRLTTYGASASFSWDEAGGYTRSLTSSISLRPSPALRISIDPGIELYRTNAQYLESLFDSNATKTYGSRYVFATLNEITLNLNTRVDWIFSPRLSLQIYAQPLVVTGDYSDLKELHRSNSYEFDVYGKDRGSISEANSGQYKIDPDGAGPSAAFDVFAPDFNFRSLVGNAVLRWEFGPGSTLFLVWQQRREDLGSEGRLELPRDLGRVFRAEMRNVLILKATYWWGV